MNLKKLFQVVLSNFTDSRDTWRERTSPAKITTRSRELVRAEASKVVRATSSGSKERSVGIIGDGSPPSSPLQNMGIPTQNTLNETVEVTVMEVSK